LVLQVLHVESARVVAHLRIAVHLQGVLALIGDAVVPELRGADSREHILQVALERHRGIVVVVAVVLVDRLLAIVVAAMFAIAPNRPSKCFIERHALSSHVFIINALTVLEHAERILTTTSKKGSWSSRKWPSAPPS
jgi:hypothetical protein